MNSTRYSLLSGSATGGGDFVSDERRGEEGAKGVGAAPVLPGERMEKGQGRVGEEGEFFPPARLGETMCSDMRYKNITFS